MKKKKRQSETLKNPKRKTWLRKYVLTDKMKLMNKKKVFSRLIVAILACIPLFFVICLLLYIFEVEYYLKSNLEKQLIKMTNNKCLNEEGCKLNIADITNFKWDQLYVFNGSKKLGQKSIENIIGTKASCFKTIDSAYGDILIFMREGKEAYCTEIYSTYEKGPEIYFVFEFNGQPIDYYFLSKNNALLGYFKKAFNKKSLVVLYPENNAQIK